MMNQLLPLLFVLTAFLNLSSCSGQEKTPKTPSKIGGACEGCEAIYEYGDKVLTSTDTLPKFQEEDSKIKITGIIYQVDGKTPAKDVILYIYHTNKDGVYETKGDEKGWAKRHGYVRGWIKTAADGRYTFYTFRPASYPNINAPAHIHATIKEPNKNEYYIDEYLFDDDPFLTELKKNNLRKRGGSGVVKTKLQSGILTAERNIILGFNIPDYE